MKVFVTGVNGQLGYDVIKECNKRNLECYGSDITNFYNGLLPLVINHYIQMDITNKELVNEIINKINPDVVIHCAAWTAVDAAEDEENKQKVWDINVEGTRNIAEACRSIDCKMIYISTDYVFSGEGEEPWDSDCENFNPVNYYGKTKLEGEFAVKELLNKYYIVRISWAYGENGNNFVKTMLKLGKDKKEIKVVNDQIGLPTNTKDLSRLLLDMAETDKYGCYNVSNEGEYISWYDFAKEIFKQTKYTVNIIPVTTEEYGLSKAKRPKNSRFNRNKTTNNNYIPLNRWDLSLNEYIDFEKSNPKISIVVPMFNTEKSLEKCVSSLLNQTYTNIEIILVNDGSTDNTLELAKELKIKDSRIKIIDLKKSGVSVARNKGIDISSGEYIGFVDSDDYVTNNMYELLIRAIQKTGKQIACCNRIVRYNKSDEYYTISNQNKFLERAESINTLLVAKDFSLNNKLFDKSIFNNIRYEENTSFEDIVPSIETAIVSNGVVFIKDYCYYYVIHKESTSHKSFSHKKMNYIFNTIKMTDMVKEKFGELEQQCDACCISSINNTIDDIYLFRKDYLEEYNFAINELKKFKNKYLKNKYIPISTKIKVFLNVNGLLSFSYYISKFKQSILNHY